MNTAVSSPQDRTGVAELLDLAAARRTRPVEVSGPLRVGVDLGTASTVLVAVDMAGVPALVVEHPSGALRDGVVVDFVGAAEVVADLRSRAVELLDVPVEAATTAFPPGVPRSDQDTCAFVLERAGFVDVALTDEIAAAQALLDIADGVVVDVGGGSTGVGVFRDGRLVDVGDRAGGGHHLDMILAGALGISTARAEQLKREDGHAHLHVLRPGLERIAESIRMLTAGHEALPVHVVGGALQIPGADEVISSRLDRPVATYAHADLITPLGIARSGS